MRLEEYTDREGNPRTSAEVKASDIHFLGQRFEATNGAAERADENSPADEEAEIGEKPKAVSSRSGKKSGSKRASTKEDAGDEVVGIVEDVIPYNRFNDFSKPRIAANLYFVHPSGRNRLQHTLFLCNLISEEIMEAALPHSPKIPVSLLPASPPVEPFKSVPPR